MTTELTRYGGGQLAPAARSTSPVWTRQGRAITRADKATELQARHDYNDARLAVHRTHLTTIVEKAEAASRAELAQDAMLHVRAVDDIVAQLAAGKPGLELTLREMQAAHASGEMQRILRRGMGI